MGKQYIGCDVPWTDEVIDFRFGTSFQGQSKYTATKFLQKGHKHIHETPIFLTLLF